MLTPSGHQAIERLTAARRASMTELLEGWDPEAHPEVVDWSRHLARALMADDDKLLADAGAAARLRPRSRARSGQGRPGSDGTETRLTVVNVQRYRPSSVAAGNRTPWIGLPVSARASSRPVDDVEDDDLLGRAGRVVVAGHQLTAPRVEDHVAAVLVMPLPPGGEASVRADVERPHDTVPAVVGDRHRSVDIDHRRIGHQPARAVADLGHRALAGHQVDADRCSGDRDTPWPCRVPEYDSLPSPLSRNQAAPMAITQSHP